MSAAAPAARPASDLALVGVTLTLSSPTFIAFAVVPLWLAFCLLDARVTRLTPRLIRLGSYSGLLRDAAARALRTLAAPTVAVLSGVAAVSAVVAPSGPPGPDASQLLESAGVSPAAGGALQVAVLWVVCIVMRVLIETFALATTFATAVAVSVAVWLWAAASASGFVALGTPADFTSYAILASLVNRPELALTVGITVSLLIAALALSAIVLDRGVRQRPIRLPIWVPPSLAAAGLVLLATLAMGTASVDFGTHATTILHGPTGTLLQMLVALVLVVGYVMWAQLRIAAALGRWGDLQLIRHGSRARQLGALAGRELLLAGVFSAAVALAVPLTYVSAGGRDLSVAPGIDLGLLAVQLTIALTLQLMFGLACVTAAMLLADSAITGLAVTGVLTALAAVPIPASAVVPVQRWTTAVLHDGGWPAAAANIVVLAAGSVFVVVLAEALARRPVSTRSLVHRFGAVSP